MAITFLASASDRTLTRPVRARETTSTIKDGSLNFDETAPPPRIHTTRSAASAPNANIFGAYPREHILGESDQHRQ